MRRLHMNDHKVAAGLALLDQEEAPQVEEKPRVAPRPSMDESKLLAQVADKGFLRSYVQHCADSTDAPWIFHLGVGIGILGALWATMSPSVLMVDLTSILTSGWYSSLPPVS